MINTKREQRNLNLSAREYENIRIIFSKNMSGKNNPVHNFGVKKKISDTLKKFYSCTENKQKQSERTNEYYSYDKNRIATSKQSKKRWEDEKYRKNIIRKSILV